MLVDSFDCRRSTIDPCGSATLLHTQPTVTAGKQSCLELGCRSYCFYCSCSEQGFLWRVGLRLSFIFPARNSLCNLPLALCDELQNWRGDLQKRGPRLAAVHWRGEYGSLCPRCGQFKLPSCCSESGDIERRLDGVQILSRQC